MATQTRNFPPLLQRKIKYGSVLVNTPFNANSITKYLPAYQLRLEKMLTDEQRLSLWKRIEKHVRICERHHFKLITQPKYVFDDGYRLDRILAFYELAQEKWEKNPGWVCKAYFKGFAYIEAVLQLRRIGVGLQSSSILGYNRKYVKHFVLYFSYIRSGMDFDDWYARKYSKLPTDIIVHNWERKTRALGLALESGFGVTLNFALSHYDDDRPVFEPEDTVSDSDWESDPCESTFRGDSLFIE